MMQFNKTVSWTLSMNEKLKDLARCPCGHSDQHQSHAPLPGADRAETDERADNGEAQSSGTKGEEQEMAFKAFQGQKKKKVPKPGGYHAPASTSSKFKKVKTQLTQNHPEAR